MKFKNERILVVQISSKTVAKCNTEQNNIDRSIISINNQNQTTYDQIRRRLPRKSSKSMSGSKIKRIKAKKDVFIFL